MEEVVVSFETAKLLKEKGFIDTIGVINGKHYYNYKGELDGDQTDYIRARLHKQDLIPFQNYAAPTLSLAQKWIREDHNTHIEIEAACDCELMILMPYVYQFYIYIDGDGYFDGLFYNTYEICLEAAINESLKRI